MTKSDMVWSVEWQGPLANEVGWDSIKADSAGDAWSRYERQHPLRKVRAVSVITICDAKE